MNRASLVKILTAAKTSAVALIASVCLAQSTAELDRRPNAVLVTNERLNIDLVTSTRVCGTTLGANPRRLCFGDPVTQAQPYGNETVGRPKRYLSGDGQFCAQDEQPGEKGFNCWQTYGIFDKPVPKILASGDPALTRFFMDRICTQKADRTVQCHVRQTDRWNSDAKKNLLVPPAVETYGPFRRLQDYQLADDTICFLDDGELNCQLFTSVDPKVSRLVVNLPKAADIKLKGMREFTLDNSRLCVLHDQGLSCFTGRAEDERKVVSNSTVWVGAKRLSSGFLRTCAEAADGQAICELNGNVSDGKLGVDGRPPELQKPGIKIKKLELAGDSMCALMSEAASPNKYELNCWYYTNKAKLPEAVVKATDFTVTTRGICATLVNGWVQCFAGLYTVNSPLPLDGIPTQRSGVCSWNSQRLQCSGIDMESTDLGYPVIKKVIAASNVEPEDLPCLLYEDQNQIRRVKCLQTGARALDESVPTTLPSDANRIASIHGFACVYGGETTLCWGQKMGGDDTPNLKAVDSMGFGLDFACANDRFGLICWGRDLDTRKLQVPKELSDFEAATDLTVSLGGACAISRQKSAICWGDNRSGQINTPELTNVHSLLMSKTTDATVCASSDEGVTCWGELRGELDRSPAKVSQSFPPGIY